MLGDALDLPPESRTAFLADLYCSDGEIAGEVRSLLVEREQPGDFLPDLPGAQPSSNLRSHVVGAYRLIRLLGIGGMGTVYLASEATGTSPGSASPAGRRCSTARRARQSTGYTQRLVEHTAGSRHLECQVTPEWRESPPSRSWRRHGAQIDIGEVELRSSATEGDRDRAVGCGPVRSDVGVAGVFG